MQTAEIILAICQSSALPKSLATKIISVRVLSKNECQLFSPAHRSSCVCPLVLRKPCEAKFMKNSGQYCLFTFHGSLNCQPSLH